MFIACLLDLDVFYFNYMILTREHKRHLLYYYFFKIDTAKFCFKELQINIFTDGLHILLSNEILTLYCLPKLMN